jgi:RNA polymerase-binding transcription factor DksA
MTKADLDRFKSTLLALKARLSGHVSHLADEALRNRKGEGAAPAPLADPADQGAESYEQESAFSLLRNQEETLGEIDEALSRIEQGRFGRCEECGAAIPRPRLNTLPFTRHCVGCARKLQ